MDDLHRELYAMIMEKEQRINSLLVEIDRLKGAFAWDNVKISYWSNKDNKLRKRPEARLLFEFGHQTVTTLGCRLYNNIDGYDKAFGSYIENSEGSERKFLKRLTKDFLQCWKEKMNIHVGLIRIVDGNNLGSVVPRWALAFSEDEQKFLLFTPKHKDFITHPSTPILGREHSKNPRACDYVAYISPTDKE